MKKLIPSKDNSIEPRGSTGKQKCGLVFWQKAGLFGHCGKYGFRIVMAAIGEKFSPTCIQTGNQGSYFLQFDNDEAKTIFFTLRKEPKSRRGYIYGEAHTAYADFAFHLFALRVIDYVAKRMKCDFYVDDATQYLAHQSVEKLKKYIESYKTDFQDSLAKFEKL